jgi:hypothetical protein
VPVDNFQKTVDNLPSYQQGMFITISQLKDFAYQNYEHYLSIKCKMTHFIMVVPNSCMKLWLYTSFRLEFSNDRSESYEQNNVDNCSTF